MTDRWGTVAVSLFALGWILFPPSARAHDFDKVDYRIAFSEFEELQFLKTGDPLVDWNSTRIWTSTDGKHLEGEITEIRQFSVAIKQTDGTSVNVPLFRFQEDDKRFIEEWRAVSEFFDLNYVAGKEPEPVNEADIRGEFIDGPKSFHETKHFRLESDVPIPKSTMRHLCKVFEATYKAMEADPLGLAVAKPIDQRFWVRLFYRMEDYNAAGGRKESGGTYLSKDRVILVPLEMTGLTSEKYTFSPHVLIHETTHALTHQWLNRAPIWFLEGFAEYMAMVPFDAEKGVLEISQRKAGIQKEIRSAMRDFPEGIAMIPPEELVLLTFQSFMGEPELEEIPIEIPPLKPPAFRSISEVPPSPESGGIVPKPPESLPAPVGSSDLVEMMRHQMSHYLSSLLLVNHLIETGQEENFRKFLFEVATYHWDASRYLKSHRAAYNEYSTAVNEQISAYNEQLRQYHQDLAVYKNEEVATAPVKELIDPDKPKKPTIPIPLRVPRILSQPRTAEELSPFRFPGVAAKRHLDLPEELQLEDWR